ncbi:metallophosphoesterase (plasmid) [Microvirga terrae]|uniref:Metallophosphoesterase n=1 Tax=Microvirga terrae TaxID=2740529 RepID=A0ABY5RZU0_9HYPH|nr:metallophosphoesterase [Microvirga terrae]UVF22770.1 metallophosphoesterase [Microvirga terrae]
MRIWFLSDLHHHSSWPFAAPAIAPACDVIVIAGDSGEEMSRKALPWTAEVFGRYGKPILYVPGNHDFYGANLAFEIRKAQLVAEHHKITLLAQGETVVLGGVRFVGATLWTDFDLGGYGHISELEAMKNMNDHRYIRFGSSYSKVRPKDLIDIHYAHRARIEQVLATPFDGPTVVVTHHAPLERSLQKGYQEGPLDAAYASDLSLLIEMYQPEIWLHGHVHVSHNYIHDNTCVRSNPRGYLMGAQMAGRGRTWPENPNFDPTLVIEVEPRPKPILQPT